MFGEKTPQAASNAYKRFIRTFPVAAGNVGWTFTVPEGKELRVDSYTTKQDNDATAATRISILSFQRDGFTLSRHVSPSSIASHTVYITWTRNGASSNVSSGTDDFYTVALPDVWHKAGTSIVFQVFNGTAGDAINVSMLVGELRDARPD